MDRDRDDPRPLSRGRGRGLLGPGSDDLPAGKFDPAEFDALPDPSPSPAARARGEADAAQAHSFFSHLAGDVQRILAGIAGFRELGADIRARLADSAARDARRADEETARDKAITARLVDPAALEARAEAGGRQGAREALSGTAGELKRQIDADAAARELLARQIASERADRRDAEMRQRRRDGWWYSALAAFALLVPAALGYGYHLGSGAGEDEGYARARDEVAAASWANTTNGKLARQLDQISTATIPLIANCSGKDWNKTKQDGQRVCYAAPTTGWYRP